MVGYNYLFLSTSNVVQIAAAPLEVSVLFLYFGGLLVLLGFGSFLVIRQVLVKRELENAAKELQVHETPVSLLDDLFITAMSINGENIPRRWFFNTEYYCITTC